jgi:glycosyl transferase family 2
MKPAWKRYAYRVIAAEISAMTRYYDRVVQSMRTPGDEGDLLAAIESPRKEFSESDIPDCSAENAQRTAVLLAGTINHHYDIEGLLRSMRPRLSRTSRIVIVAFNPYLQWLYWLALHFGFKSGVMPTTFVTRTDLDNICRLAGYERVRYRHVLYCPWRLLGLGSAINALMPAIPLLKHLSLTSVIVLRPLIEAPAASPPTLSIVVPARNERGNIAPAVERLIATGISAEVIFVEGHSTDGTWEEIERVRAQGAPRLTIKALQQTGRGKADAVRLGFASATGDLLTILDADLTMPPELLPRFIDAWMTGKADFVNGSRIVYAMEGEAMRFLNRLGNVFFAKALTSVLGVRLGDCLCGTKLVMRADYVRMQAWRQDFGDFDPFGDFELLFPAAILALGIIDVPIRYRARTYGATNINRFRHGLMLLRMTIVGLFRVKFGKLP